MVPHGGESPSFKKPIQLVLKGSIKDGDCVNGYSAEPMKGGKKEDVADDLFSEYMNLDNIDNLNFSGLEDKDLDSKTSGSKTIESSDNEVDSNVNGKTSGVAQ